MTLGRFMNDHTRYNISTDRPEIYGLAILNAAPGQECMKMCGLFGVPMSSAMIKGGPDEDYVSFIADKDACAHYWIGGAYDPDKKVKTVYYPDIEPILDDIFVQFPEWAEQIPGAIKEVFDSNELYKLLGMGVLVEES